MAIAGETQANGETRMARLKGPGPCEIVAALAFVSFVAVATAGLSPLFLAIVLCAALAMEIIRELFPASRLFPVAFGHLFAVYAAIFSLFVEEVFSLVNVWILGVGFGLPIFFFVIGCWLRQTQIRAVVAHPAIRDQRRLI